LRTTQHIPCQIPRPQRRACARREAPPCAPVAPIKAVAADCKHFPGSRTRLIWLPHIRIHQSVHQISTNGTQSDTPVKPLRLPPPAQSPGNNNQPSIISLGLPSTADREHHTPRRAEGRSPRRQSQAEKPAAAIYAVHA